jgi:tRNA(Arg) A34 adenosine deaminase TadA
MPPRSRSSSLNRRHIFAAPLLFAPLGPAHADEHCGDAAFFAAEAQRMKEAAIAAGDQAYGAVVVFDGCIIGYGPSRVVQDNNIDAHAERVALWDAQKRLGQKDLAGAVIYSTSRPCMICQPALAAAQVSRMYVGAKAADAGPPKSDS